MPSYMEQENKGLIGCLKDMISTSSTLTELVSTIREELSRRPDIQLIIIDEASAYRDATTNRHRTIRKSLQLRKYFWMMTGTPVSNGPLVAYGLAKLVTDSYGESFTGYKDRVMFRVSNFKWIPKEGAHGEAYKLLQPSIRFSLG